MSEPVVDIHVVVLCMRLMDMQKMCARLAELCKERKNEKTARRLSRAAVGFGEILEEVTNNARQGTLFK